ncbi:DEAD/DEAH box helicase [Candidatus Woesebacteria bacterium]|nr:DEAD/DEAH box helicase [Candidatus Woesebacteria bacterium]
MYNQPNRYSGNSSRHSGGRDFNHNSNRGFGRSRRQQSTFDPSMLVKQAVVSPVIAPAYQTQHSFADFEVCEPLKQNIVKRGYVTPTPIQDQAIPHLLQGRDIIGLANTGTGKTAAFLIPLINKIYQNSGKALIIAPTRELAVQIQDEFKLFAQGMKLYSTLCIGGASMSNQIYSLRRDNDFVIGTPGRLIDLEKRGIINMGEFESIVLDEVDHMFDMGFIQDVKYIISKLPNKRHSLFFSATLPAKLQDVVHQFLYNPVKVTIETQKASANVNQDIIKVNGQSKVDLLHDLLNQDGFEKVLVFGRTKHGLNKLSQALLTRGIRVAAIHGNKSQAQRQKALAQFKKDAIQVLLATDIASRGLDIDNVTHVINYDLPQTYEDYIHRIGRTGRANKTGIALSFVD